MHLTIRRTPCARYLSLRPLVSHAIARSKVRHAVVHGVRAHAVLTTPDLPDLTPAPPLGVSVCPRFPTAALLQLCEAVGCVTSAKDMVALNLAHKCDELESQLEPFKSSSQDSALTLGPHKPAPYCAASHICNLRVHGNACVCHEAPFHCLCVGGPPSCLTGLTMKHSTPTARGAG